MMKRTMNSSGVEEALWLDSFSSNEHSIVEHVCSISKETNSGGKAGILEGTCNPKLSNFNERTFFFMFEDGISQCRNLVIELGGKVEEFFDVVNVTDLVVDRENEKSAQLAKFNSDSRGERAINCSSKTFPTRNNVVDIALENNISVYTRSEFYQLVQSKQLRWNKTTETSMAQKRYEVRTLRPPFIKVEDQSRKFCPIFKEFEKWPTLDFDNKEDNHQPTTSKPAMGLLEKVDKRIYCKHCEEYLL